ncbi:MAG: SDR family NAD(P)-dependent oxidoreductase [Deltaproteobacteria bacterium]|nr:SDR family NAD(P)-dependent oxidoreductase [Deltaproteobacteria bacterium]MBW2420743.1 SDR family NAD(P)-dependent oxidoreductase [Deltaproteobacteria bacterium]
MRGKTVMITGFTAGVGRAAAFALAAQGAELVLVGRNADKGRAVVEAIREETGCEKVEMLVGDLASQEEVRRIAGEFLSTERPLHVLFNNAGVVMQKRLLTRDGLETTFAVNHLAYFLLTNLLLERLRASAPARVVCTASDAHQVFSKGGLDFDDLQAEGRYKTFEVYGRSKLANILFTRELARRESESGVTANSFHPGFVGSDFAKNNGRFANIVMRLLSPFARSPEKGAETGVYLCNSAEVADVSGGYFCDQKPLEPADWAKRPEDAERLWRVSEELTRLT